MGLHVSEYEAYVDIFGHILTVALSAEDVWAYVLFARSIRQIRTFQVESVVFTRQHILLNSSGVQVVPLAES